jgi:hypothetical protein
VCVTCKLMYEKSSKGCGLAFTVTRRRK